MLFCHGELCGLAAPKADCRKTTHDCWGRRKKKVDVFVRFPITDLHDLMSNEQDCTKFAFDLSEYRTSGCSFLMF